MNNGMSVEQIVASYDEAAPLTEASTIPAPWYVDARIAELERQTVFSQTWQVMGRVDQVEKPGQFVTATVAGEPLVAVRGNDGVLRAFYNVCRHHAAARPGWLDDRPRARSSGITNRHTEGHHSAIRRPSG